MTTLLEVQNLRTSFFTYGGEVKAVDGISFTLGRGEVIAVVGESGCGKSQTALSILRLLAESGKIVGGSIRFDGRDLLRCSDVEMRAVRGNEISMIFQDPMTCLNPLLTIGTQLTEVLRLHQKMNGRDARRRAVEMLDVVGIPNPERRLRQYPHEFSGGMRQRVMIAMALATNPKLLIADEPTTALDVTVQAQIMDLMRDLRGRFDTSIILITHDLGVVAGMAERVLVMYAGKIIEEGPVRDIFAAPRHPYTWGLIKSVPRLNDQHQRRLVPIHGQPPDLIAPPAGCRFHPRCEYALNVCLEDQPEFSGETGAHRVACWRYHAEAPQLVFPANTVPLAMVEERRSAP